MSEAATEVSEKDIDKWAHVGELSCRLEIDLPVSRFRVADWIVLTAQSVIDTHCAVGSGVPLRVNGVLLAWCEFEVVENHLAVRVTDLA